MSNPQAAQAFTWGTQTGQYVTWYGNGYGNGYAKSTGWWWKLENGVTIKFWLNGIGERSCSFLTYGNAWQFDYNWYWITYDPAKYGNTYPCQYGGPGWY